MFKEFLDRVGLVVAESADGVAGLDVRERLEVLGIDPAQVAELDARELSLDLLRLSGTRDEFPNQDVTLRGTVSSDRVFKDTWPNSSILSPSVV